MNLFGKKQKKVEVETLSTEALTKDADGDGTPDHLQRENYASIVNSNKDFIKWESDVDAEVEQYIMGLRGYGFNVDTSTWEPRSPPTLNEAGISYIKSMLGSIVNKHSINTFITSDELNMIVLSHMTALVTSLKYRKKVFAVNLADLDSVALGFDNFITIILSRSVNDKQRIHNDNRLSMNYSSNDSKPMM